MNDQMRQERGTNCPDGCALCTSSECPRLSPSSDSVINPLSCCCCCFGPSRMRPSRFLFRHFRIFLSYCGKQHFLEYLGTFFPSFHTEDWARACFLPEIWSGFGSSTLGVVILHCLLVLFIFHHNLLDQSASSLSWFYLDALLSNAAFEENHCSVVC